MLFLSSFMMQKNQTSSNLEASDDENIVKSNLDNLGEKKIEQPEEKEQEEKEYESIYNPTFEEVRKTINTLKISIFGVYQTDFALPLDQVEEISEYSYEKCLLMRKIFYEGQCWELLSKGPCDKNQWLVLEWSNDDREQQEPMKARCAKRRCNESDVYWPQDGFCYNAETARHRRLCPGADTELAADEFGDGHCKCRNGDRVPYVRVAPADRNYYYGDEDSKPCYPLYAKGPCPRGQVLIPVGLGFVVLWINHYWPSFYFSTYAIWVVFKVSVASI
ncbi:Domain of unknown function DUF4789 [Cinara cedri]|uniref:DUF4789 domain-containing protein n=1 Tax=Cinara cedri TaxID=506608 RepID=A0A5E4MRK3_9HEMI|nr:Domain of unknown function DUF4789 [Cinara cedri]